MVAKKIPNKGIVQLAKWHIDNETADFLLQNKSWSEKPQESSREFMLNKTTKNLIWTYV